MDDKETGSSLVVMATEAGEKLYPNTSADGREMIRQQLRHLKEAWDVLYEDVMSSQRQLDVSELQWTSFKDSADQLESWLTGMEGQLNGYTSLHATLDEKKSQLRGCKVGGMAKGGAKIVELVSKCLTFALLRFLCLQSLASFVLSPLICLLTLYFRKQLVICNYFHAFCLCTLLSQGSFSSMGEIHLFSSPNGAHANKFHLKLLHLS